MWSHSTCIAVRSKMPSPMKTWSKTRIAGVLTLPAGRKPGRSSRNGSGTCAWSWDISLSLSRCAPPSLLPLCPRPKSSSLPPRAMASPRLPHPGKLAASLGRTSSSSLTGRCAVQPISHLVAHERRKEADGSLRVVYAASIRSCRPCPLRDQCQWNGSATAKPRQVSVLLHPLVVGSAPLLWRDWSRREHRRAWMQLVRHQHIEVSLQPPVAASPGEAEVILSRAQRAHSRLSWPERLARNVRVPTANQVTIRLFGVPEAFATSLGLATV